MEGALQHITKLHTQRFCAHCGLSHEKSGSTLLKAQTAKKNTRHLFLVAGNSGELGLDEVSGLFSRANWLLSRVFWVLGDTSRLEDVLGEGRKYLFDAHRTS